MKPSIVKPSVAKRTCPFHREFARLFFPPGGLPFAPRESRKRGACTRLALTGPNSSSLPTNESSSGVTSSSPEMLFVVSISVQLSTVSRRCTERRASFKSNAEFDANSALLSPRRFVNEHRLFYEVSYVGIFFSYQFRSRTLVKRNRGTARVGK